MRWLYKEEFSIVSTGISLDAGAISCKQEVSVFLWVMWLLLLTSCLGLSEKSRHTDLKLCQDFTSHHLSSSRHSRSHCSVFLSLPQNNRAWLMNCSLLMEDVSVLAYSFIFFLYFSHIFILCVFLQKLHLRLLIRPLCEAFLWFKWREVRWREVVSNGLLDSSFIGEALIKSFYCASSKPPLSSWHYSLDDLIVTCRFVKFLL